MNTPLTATRPQDKTWDQFVRKQPRAHLLQLSAWGALKSDFGWQSRTVALADGDSIVAGALVLLKPLPLRMGLMAYLPMGPYVNETRHYPLLWNAIRRETKAAFLKLEPGHIQELNPRDFSSFGFVPSPQSIQPANTIQIDIRADDAAILKRMNQGTRRKIRKSLKADIDYVEGGLADLDDFMHLMRMTGQRNDFGVHSEAYYRRVIELFIPQHGALLMARHHGKALGGLMVFAVGQTAWYFYGASSREKNNLYASYGLQWRAIEWAKNRGCACYDMWGIPDCDEATLEAQFQHRSDGLWGVYGFKRGWGGVIRRASGPWDLPFNPLVYQAYRAALTIKNRRS